MNASLVSDCLRTSKLPYTGATENLSFLPSVRKVKICKLWAVTALNVVQMTGDIENPACSSPQAVPNSNFTAIRQQYYRREDVRYECAEGYFLEGPSLQRCMENGTWAPTQQIVCRGKLYDPGPSRKIHRLAFFVEAKQCPVPEVPRNGAMRGVEYKEGKTVDFSCSPGYLLTGTATIRCTNQGKWSPEPRVLCKGAVKFQISAIIASY